MDTYVKHLLFPHFLFSGFKHDFIRYVDLFYFILFLATRTASDESVIRSRIEYLIQTYHIIVLIL